MKIQCDVCNREEASLFCSADEAALCHGCDYRIHHANKLATEHNRFPLLHPSSKEAPRCDICQERRAFLFCREDRAILCIDCDFSIHTANEHTRKHHRFLLTGVKLSATSLTSDESCNTAVPTELNPSQVPMKKKPNSVADPPPLLTLFRTNTTTSTPKVVDDVSISEYLIEMLPGWQVDEFLDSSAPFGFCQTGFTTPFVQEDLESNRSFHSEDFGIWVPQVPQAPPPLNYNISVHNGFNGFSHWT